MTVSNMSPRLGWIPGDWRGLQGTRKMAEDGGESPCSAERRAPTSTIDGRGFAPAFVCAGREAKVES